MEDIIQNTEEKMMLSIEALENKCANVIIETLVQKLLIWWCSYKFHKNSPKNNYYWFKFLHHIL